MKQKAKTSPLLAKMLSATANKNANLAPTTSSANPPANKETHDILNTAINLHHVGKINDAEKIYNSILANAETLNPVQRARALSLLGTVYLQRNEFEAARLTLNQALSFNDKDASTQNNLGVTYKQLNNKDASITCLKRAVDLDANYVDALNNYGAALLDQKKDAAQIYEAIKYLDRVISINPNHADAHYNRGTALQSLNLLDDAEASFQRAIAINPNCISALFNSGLLRLLRGEFEQGWRLYEYRWADEQACAYERNFSQPLWLNDAEIKDKTIFLYTEQGFGDFIQFCRYALMVEKLGANIILLVPKELMELAESLSKNFKLLPRFGTQTSINSDFDYHCPLMSLPLAFKTKLDTVPSHSPQITFPYLTVPAKIQALWTNKLQQINANTLQKLRVGLVWSGAAGHLNDVNRSLKLTEIASILSKDIEYHVLQKEIRASDIDALNALKITHSIYIHCNELITFTDTAALINEMDIVISVDTSVAHLAGALGKPLWLLIPFFPDFRWLLAREDSPWYPSAKLFRQPAMGDWSKPLAAVAKALNEAVNNKKIANPKAEFHSISSINIDSQALADEQVQRASITHALAQHQAGKLQDALSAYLLLLEADANNTEVLTLLASLYLQQKNYGDARIIFQKSLSIDDKNPLTLHNYGLLLEKLNRNDEAIHYLDLAIALNPTYEDAYKHKCNLLKKTGKLTEIKCVYEKALSHINTSADLYFRYANHLREVEQNIEALAAIDKAITLRPNHAESFNNRGNILLDLKDPREALKSYHQALTVKPNYANAYNNSANAYLALNQFDDAIAACDAALTIDPKLFTTLNNRANALQKLQRFDEALEAYNLIIDEHKDYSFAPLNKGLLCLLLGNFSEGWALYEWRWKNSPQTHLLDIFKQPLWLGKENIADKTVLLYAEQGFGDTLQFCRYVKLVAGLGAKKVYVNVPKMLFDLIKPSFASYETVTVLTDGDVVPNFDYQCPMLSLPLAFNTELTSIPNNVPYLFADSVRVKQWLSRLNKNSKKNTQKSKHRIGLVWSGSVAYSNDSNRSIMLNLLSKFITNLSALGIEFHCLQKEIKPEDTDIFSVLEAQGYMFAHQEQLTDFAETAALIENMDLVISVDTSVAHLAGALGKALWVLLPYVPDFRWLLNRDDSPWYPTAKLFRQTKSGDWLDVMSALGQQISTYFNLSKKTLLMQGNTLSEQGLLNETVNLLKQKVLLNPQNAIAHNNLGVALQKLKQFDGALAHYSQAIQLSADYISPRLNKAFLSLQLGEFKEGWQLYEWRWKNAQWTHDYRPFNEPLWLGDAPIKDKTILIYPEQGIGDYLQFCRFFSLFKSDTKIIAEAPAALLKVLKKSFAKCTNVTWIALGDKLPAFDYQCPILSLPLAFKNTLTNIPAKTPYLRALPADVKTLQNKLPAKTKPRIGIVWAGSLTHRNHQQRNIAINDLVALLQLKFEFHVLQKVISHSDSTVLGMLKSFGANINYYLATNTQHAEICITDYADTAALIHEMDLIITVDTSVAHLAGAMGKPVWVLLPETSDFRWLLNREDSPWYPTARLFRQTTEGDWATAIQKVIVALKMQF